MRVGRRGARVSQAATDMQGTSPVVATRSPRYPYGKQPWQFRDHGYIFHGLNGGVSRAYRPDIAVSMPATRSHLEVR